jgi:hypothetical protein
MNKKILSRPLRQGHVLHTPRFSDPAPAWAPGMVNEAMVANVFLISVLVARLLGCSKH